MTEVRSEVFPGNTWTLLLNQMLMLKNIRGYYATTILSCVHVILSWNIHSKMPAVVPFPMVQKCSVDFSTWCLGVCSKVKHFGWLTLFAHNATGKNVITLHNVDTSSSTL